MALLELRSDIQSERYFAAHYSTRNVNLEVGSSIWPLNNCDNFLKSGQPFNGTVSLPSAEKQLEHNQEVIRQTMLKHESTFKHQLQELHRLYRRQRELMYEMRRNEFYRHHLHHETFQSNLFLPQCSVEIAQNSHISSLPCMKYVVPNHVSCAENKLLPSNFVKGKSIHLGRDRVRTEGSSDDSDLLGSKCKKYGKKILDLELPADEYMDGDKDESLAEKNSSTPGSYSSKGKGLADLNEPITLEEEEAVQNSNFLLGPFDGHREIYYPDVSGNSSSGFTVMSKEVLQNAQRRSNLEASSHIEQLEKNGWQQEGIPDKDEDDQVDGESCSERKIFGLEIFGKDLFNKNCSALAGASDQQTEQQLVPYADADSELSAVSCWRRHTHDTVRAPIAIQALPCFSSVPSSKRARSSIGSPGVSGDCPLKSIRGSMDTESAMRVDLNCTSPDVAISQSIRASEERKIEDSKQKFVPLQANSSCHTDVESKKVEGSSSLFEKPNASNNHCLSRSLSAKGRILDIDLECDPVPESDEEQTAKDPVSDSKSNKKLASFGVLIDLNSCIDEDDISTTRELKAPTSPENKESSPPRGESDETQLEIQMELSGHKNDLLEEKARIAVEAIISLSSSDVKASVKRPSCPPFEASESDSLQWFAEVASSVVDDPESEFGFVLSSCITDEIDYFEVMTLNLTESKTGEYFCRNFDPKEEQALALILPTEPTRVGRRRGRQQKKDFQTEILPSLASLSRCEVTEDLQIIGGLIDATGTHQNTGLARNMRKNGCGKGRKRPRVSSSKQQISNIEIGNGEKWVVDWGKITRRPRGPRSPAAKPWPILWQV